MKTSAKVRRPTPRSPPPKRLLHRLIGIETEYATLVADRQELDPDDLPPSQMVYNQICEAIGRQQPTAAGLFNSDQLFLASGGAISFESHPTFHSLPGGLMEVATPEVIGPELLLQCSRSVDAIIADAAADSETGFDIRILKNSSDALGHLYGCHENYEVEVARGLGLIVYRCAIVSLWIMQLMTLALTVPLMTLVVALIALKRIIGRRPVEDDADGADGAPWSNPQEDLFSVLPPPMASVVVTLMRWIHLPIVWGLRGVARHLAFRRQRRYLTAMLASRVALCGAGHLDHDGRYHLSPKAIATDAVADLGGFNGERPIYVFGHWLGQLTAKSFLSLTATGHLLSRRQRLQIGLSDSNLSDLATYVKVGSVSLVLDMIDAGATADLPQMKKVIDSVHRLGSDWNLVTRVPTTRGEMSALEIQAVYLNAAEAFVRSTPENQRGESDLVLRRWRELQDAAKAFRKNANDREPGLGKIDWLTKRFFLDSLGEDRPWEYRKKIDLRYHELSPDGYYWQFMVARPDLDLVSSADIESRRRSPPPGTPASRRAWLIREFAGTSEAISSEWDYAIIGSGKSRRRIEFHR